MSLIKNIGALCRMVKIEHSIFALPFAYAGAILAYSRQEGRGLPDLWTVVLLTVAMVGIRSFAMGMNRLLDLPFDRKNPRTAKRPLVTGELTPWQAWRFCGVMAAAFVLACAALNQVCLALSFPTLIVAAAYSYAKRFTWACHFILGAVIGLAPLAGWLSVSPHFALAPVLLALAVLFWIAGFDILYACQDILFDAESGLHSAPVRLGVGGAMQISSFCHVNTMIFLALAGMSLGLGFGWYFCLLIIGGILWWEHGLVSPTRLEYLGTAFALNGPISVLLLLGALLAVYA